MALLPLRIDCTSKPPIGTPLRSDGHWSTQGLVGFWLFNEASVPGTTDIIGDVKPTVLGTPVVTPDGVNMAITLNNDGLRYENPKYNLTGDVTIVTKFRQLRTDGSSYSRLSQFGQIGGAGATSFALRRNGSLTALRFTTNDDAGLATQTNGFSVVLGTVYTAVGMIKNGYAYLYINGVLIHSIILASVTTSHPTWAYSIGCDGVGRSGGYEVHHNMLYNRALSDAEIKSLHENPYQVCEPEILWVNVGGGATAYTETLAQTIAALSTLTDNQAVIEAASSLITAGISATDTRQMVESLVSTASATTSLTDLATRTESLLENIQAVSSVADARQMVETLLTSATTITALTDIHQPASGNYIEDLQVAAQGITSIADAATMLETLLQTATAQTTLVDAQFQHITENLTSAITAATSLADLQFMVENVTALATATTSAVDTLGSISTYLEELVSTAFAFIGATERFDGGYGSIRLIATMRGSAPGLTIRGSAPVNQITGRSAQMRIYAND